MKLRLGTLGLYTAMILYGSDCIQSVGDFATPGIAEIPDEDIVVFKQLVSEKLAETEKGR